MSKVFRELVEAGGDAPQQLELELGLAAADEAGAGKARPRRLSAADAAVELERLRRQLVHRETELAALKGALSERGREPEEAVSAKARCLQLDSELAEMRRTLELQRDEHAAAMRAAEQELERLRAEVRALKAAEAKAASDAMTRDGRIQQLLAALDEERRLRSEAKERFLAVERELVDKHLSEQSELKEQLRELQARCSDIESRAAAVERRRAQLEADSALAAKRHEQELCGLKEKLRLLEAQDKRPAVEFRSMEAKLAGALDELDRERRLREEACARAEESERLLKRMADADAKRAQRSTVRFAFRFAGAAAVLLIAVGALAFAAGVRHGRRPAAEAPDAALAAARPPLFLETRPRPQPPAWPSINMPDVLTRATADELTIVFAYGVFSRSVEMLPEARAALLALAERIRPALAEGRMTLEIEGHADSSAAGGAQARSENLELSRLRALAVKNLLATDGLLPEAALSIAAAGSADPPYSNHTAEMRQKNRTVVLRLKPRAAADAAGED